MALAELYVEGGKKLNDEHGEKIRTKLAGKRLQVMLDPDDVNDKQAVTNIRGVEKEIVQALRDQAPLLVHAKDLVFKKPVKALGDCKLMIRIEAKPAFPCNLMLQVPGQAKPAKPPAPGSYTIDSLYEKAKFSDILAVRFCRATIDYTVSQSGGGMAKQCASFMRVLHKKVVAEVDAAVTKTVVVLNKGIEAKGSAAMSWDDAKKLVDQLNKDVQRIINTIADQGNAGLAKIMPGSSAGDGPCSVTAMFSKFQILGSVYFAGGGPPSANEKSIKPLGSAVAKLDTVAGQLDASTGTLVKVVDGFCAAVRKALLADKAASPADEPDAREAKKKAGADDSGPSAPAKGDVKAQAARIGGGLEKRLAYLRKAIEQNSALLEAEYKQAGVLSDLVGKIKRVNDKETKESHGAEDKKEHLVLARELDLFSKQVDQFESTLTESMRLCEAMSGLAQPPACYSLEGVKKIQDSADTLEQKRLHVITKRLLRMCETAIDLIED